MTKQTEALRMAHTTFMQINERFPRRDNGDGYFDKEITACKEALEPEVELADTISVEDYQKLREQPVVKDSLTAQKQWQGLSDDEIWDIANFLGKNKEWDYPVMFAKTIEKALKEKNNG